MNKSHDGLDGRAIPLRVHTTGGANASVTATLPGVAGWVTVISGYDFTGTGATVGTVVDITTGSLSIPRKMEVPASPLQIASDSFRPPYPLAVAPGNSIAVTVPALGAGNLGGQLTVYGYRVKA